MFNPDRIDTLIARLRDLNQADERLIMALARFELELVMKSELEFRPNPEPDMAAFTQRPPELEPRLLVR